MSFVTRGAGGGGGGGGEEEDEARSLFNSNSHR